MLLSALLHWAAQLPLGPLPAPSPHGFRYKAGVGSIALAAAAAEEEEEVVRAPAVAVEGDMAVCTLGPAPGPEVEHCRPHIFWWGIRPVTLWASWV